jgi:hypothetical protein
MVSADFALENMALREFGESRALVLANDQLGFEVAESTRKGKNG